MPNSNTQFVGLQRKTKFLWIKGEEVEYYDFHPKFLVDPTPIFLVSGWLGQAIAWLLLAEVLVALGRRVVIVDMPHGVRNTIFSLNPLHWPLLRHVTVIRAVLDHLKFEKVDVVAHSMGAQVVALMAERFGNVRKMVLLNPSGLTPWGILLPLRNRRHIKQSMVSAVAQGPEAVIKRKQIDEAVGKAFKKTWFLSSMEFFPIMFVSIAKRLGKLARSGASVWVLPGKNDKLFPYEGVRRSVRYMGVTYLLIKGVHDELFTNPQDIRDDLLRALGIRTKRVCR